MRCLSILATLALGASLGLFLRAGSGREAGIPLSAPYSNDNLHQWACDTAINYDKSNSKIGGGCYDICHALSWKVEITGRARAGVTEGAGLYTGTLERGDFIPQGLSDAFWDGGPGYDLANACAIVLFGAEW